MDMRSPGLPSPRWRNTFQILYILGLRQALFIAMIGDFVCGLLIVFGLATRWAVLFGFFNIFVAWSLVHHFAFFGRGSGEHGETIVLYLGALLAIACSGAGRYSLDSVLTDPQPDLRSNM
jgi:uncharacterized membrane protein YphA (DoxX/SURF4 family)